MGEWEHANIQMGLGKSVSHGGAINQFEGTRALEWLRMDRLLGAGLEGVKVGVQALIFH